MRRIIMELVVLTMLFVFLLASCVQEIVPPPGNRADYYFVQLKMPDDIPNYQGYMLKSDVDAWQSETLKGKVRIYSDQTYIIDSNDIITITINRQMTE